MNGTTNGMRNGRWASSGLSDARGLRWTWTGLRRRAPGAAPADLAPYRRIAIQLHHDLPRPDGLRSVLLTSPRPSDHRLRGGTTLAFCMADELRRPILLVDACPRTPDLSRELQCGGLRGFGDFLADPAIPLKSLVARTTHPHLFVLPAGTIPGEDAAIKPDNAGILLRAACQEFDFALLVGGPILDDSMTLAAAPDVGCVLLLAAEGETRVEDLDAAHEALSFCRARKVALVLTTRFRVGD